jgi:hypothetical protein
VEINVTYVVILRQLFTLPVYQKRPLCIVHRISGLYDVLFLACCHKLIVEKTAVFD